MRVALVGGIYGKSAAYRQGHGIAPETTLEDGLRRRGIDVSTFSHFRPFRCGEFDLVHVHHLSWGALRMAADRSPAAFVFTPHRMAESLAGHYRAAMRFVLRRADAAIALSGEEKAMQQRRYGVEPGASTVIANGIPAGIYAMRRENRAGCGSPWKLLYAGQLIALKRVDVLLEAVQRLAFPVELTLVYQNAELESALRAQASRLGIAERVHFAGRKNPEQLCLLYNSSDLFVLPSSSEALPTVVSEAMMCGTPIVATDVGGVREQLSGFGTLVPPGSPEALASAIAATISNYARIRQQAGPMSAHAQATFSIDAMVEKHLEIYRALTARPDRRRSRAGLGAGNRLARLGLRLWPKARPAAPPA